MAKERGKRKRRDGDGLMEETHVETQVGSRDNEQLKYSWYFEHAELINPDVGRAETGTR